MACFWGSEESKDQIDQLNSEITSLKKELVQLKRENKELESNSNSDNVDNTNNDNSNSYETIKEERDSALKENDAIKEKRESSKKRARQLKEEHGIEIEKLRHEISKIEDERNSLLVVKKNDNDEELNKYKKKCADLEQKNEENQNEIQDLKAHNLTLKASKELLQKKDKLKQEEIDNLQKEIERMKSSHSKLTEKGTQKKIDSEDEKEKEEPIKHKKKNKKYNLNKLEHQIQILHSESSMAKSLLLCCKPQYIQKEDNETRNFSFLQFLETSLSDKVVEQLFSKFNKASVDGKQLVSLLTLSVIIYKVKLHKMRTGSTDKPKMDSTKIKESVEHLAAWIIRTYGVKTEQTKTITVINDDGHKVNGEFYIYNVNFTKSTFGADIRKWTAKYVNDDGAYSES